MSYFRAEELSLHFGGLKAVDSVSFAVEKGEILSIIGPNGAGKSSIFNLISRIYDPAEGDIRFDGRSILDKAPYEIARLGIARTFQNIELFDQATVMQNLLVGRHRHRHSRVWNELAFTPFVRAEERRHREAIEKVIDFLDLQAYRDKYIAGLPYGVRKVVEMGRALAIEPRLLLLDEPASGLSVEETQEVAFWVEDLKKQMGITVLMVEHDMHLVSAVSDRVLALADGKMLALGTSHEVQNHPKVIEAYIGAADIDEKVVA